MKYKLTPVIFFNQCFDKRRFNSFLHWFLKKNHHGHYRLLKFLEKIKLLGFHSATEAGFSISIDDLRIPKSKSYTLLASENEIFKTDFDLVIGNLTAIEHYQGTLEIWNRTSEKLKNQVLESFKFFDFFNPVYFMSFSGARGNISQIRQLVGMRGLMADPQGQIIDFPIRSNFREGLTLTEYLISCSGARKGIVDTALRTAASGYLTRRLVDVAHHVIVSQIDCNDSRGIIIEDLYDNKQKKILSLKQRLIGRILAEQIYCPSKCVIIGLKNQEISKKVSQKICEVRQKVQIRSPLTCKSNRFICQFCYGWNLAEGQLVSIGEAVGILAAQSIGEPGTQLTMRTFHTGGVFTGVLLDKIYAPCTGKIKYLFSCIGFLIRTQQGKIAYLTKNNGTFQIKKSQQKKIKFNFQNGSLLYVKEGEDILQTQLMAEIPFFENENNFEFENEQTVLSLTSGEIYVENFVLFEKTKFDFLKRKQTNCLQGINKFWILSAQFLSIWKKQRNCFFQELDLTDKSIPFRQIVLSHPNKYFVKQVSEVPIFFKNLGYLSTRPILNAKFLTTRFTFREIINFPQLWNMPPITLWEKITKYLINTSYHVFSIFSFQIQHKHKKINQNLFIFFINRQGIYKYRTKTIYSTTNSNRTFQLNKENFLNSVFPKNFLKNFCSNCIRQNFQVKPRILHWKNISTSQYIFAAIFLRKIFPHQYKYYFCKFQKKQNQLKIGDNVYIRILLYFRKNRRWFRKRKENKKLSSNIIQEKWCFFGHKSETGSSTYLKNFIQKKKKKNLPLRNKDFIIFPSLKNFSNVKQENIFILEKILPHSIISQRNLIKVDLTKIQQKTINFYLNTYCFLLKNFSFLKNFKIRFLNRKPQKPVQKFMNFRKNIQKKKNSRKLSVKRNKNIYNFLKIQTNKYNEQVESISKKSLIFQKNQISKNFQKYKIRYLKSLIPKKKQYSKLFKKNFNRTFFLFVSSSKCWTFMINNRNYLYSINKKQTTVGGPATKFFKISKNLRFSLFNKIKIILNDWKYLKKINQKKSKKKFFPFLKFQIPYFSNKNKFELLNIRPISFHLFSYYSPKFQLLSEKNKSLFSKIKNINLKIIQKKFFYSFENPIFIRLFSFFTNSEILNPLVKIQKHNFLFTNIENYFSCKFLPLQKKKIKLFLINNFQNRKKLCLCLLGKKFSEIDNFQQMLGSFFGRDELTTNYEGLLVAKTYNTLLFRKTTNYLLSDQSILYIYHGEIIYKNQPLYSIFFNQAKTGDIVQGIPKIEEVFEARKKSKYNFQEFLKKISKREMKKQLENFQGLQELQASVINNIQRIYCGQGIHISDKHIEIIVRQMTSNVLILEPGETGLLHGEIVAFEWVHRMNNLNYSSNQIKYEPILLGMTKTCLETSSFLSAASFQETTRILGRAAIQNQTDFLRGLKQNVILGKLVPIGTGYF